VSVKSPTLAERISARALIHRAEVMGRPIEPALVEKAKLIVRNAEEQDTRRAQNPIGNPA
jgi:hypothetical protein